MGLMMSLECMALFMKGFNVVSMDARLRKTPVEDVYNTVEQYQDTGIDLFVIGSHGARIWPISKKHLIGMFTPGAHIQKSILDIAGNILGIENAKFLIDNVETVKFLKGLSDAIVGKPISILLTSCKGQLAVSEFEENLPVGSEILTLGEKQELLGKHQHLDTRGGNVKNFYKFLAKEAEHLDADAMDIQALSTIYASKIIYGTSTFGFGSPYYSKITEKGLHGYSCISVVDEEKYNIEAIQGAKENFGKMICTSDNTNCQDKASRFVDLFLEDQSKFSTEALMNLREGGDTIDFPMMLAFNCWAASLVEEEQSPLADQITQVDLSVHL